ncbi:MAG: hypothetical protein Q7L07_02680 [Pseudohongiella sp.]|nr:hypothetical protein [Pseudohongiella sp.]
MSNKKDTRVSAQADDPYYVDVPRVAVPDLENGQPHWLVRPSTIRLLWWIFGVILALTVIAQIFIHLHDYFTLDGFFGFYAIFGFVSCLAMVVFAKLLGVFLKRPDTYYDDL